MIKYDLYTYASKHWQKYVKSINDLSEAYGQGNLIEANFDAYDFDAITKDEFRADGVCPHSADCIYCHDDLIDVIEFKRGFLSSHKVKEIAENEGKNKEALAEKQANLRVKVLIKAIQSYITLEKRFFPLCVIKDNEKVFSLNYTVVIDGEPVDSMMNSLAELSKKPGFRPEDKKLIKEMNTWLKSLEKYYDCKKDKYYYDKVRVTTAYKFNDLFS